MSPGGKGKGSRRRPGELEGDVLAVLWDAGEPLSPSEVQERFDEDLAYATISTILTRLHAKNLVVRTSRGRAHLYEPSVTRAAHVAGQVRRLLEQGDDRAAVLRGLLDGLSKSDERALRKLLEHADAPETGRRPKRGS
jgi:predicted transcriptional regulator